jgi:RHS repeat-associated protein
MKISKNEICLRSTISASRGSCSQAGYEYQFRVRAADRVGNLGEWVTGSLAAVQNVTIYYYAGSVRVAMRQGERVTYLLTDHLGSTQVTADEQGSELGRYLYTAWGETRQVSGETATDRLYTGQRQEAEIGLYYYNARWYDPALGRFVQADTIVPEPGNVLAWDRYAYVYNNPIRYTDPSGHAACLDAECKIVSNPNNGRLMSREGSLYSVAQAVLKELGGINDLEAMAIIADVGASMYGTWDKLMPKLTQIFTGKEESNPLTIWNAAMHNMGCAGLGRDPGDCPNNFGLGNSFNGQGFHPDFQDGHNQLFHFWSYVATVAAADGPFPPIGQISGLFVSELANVYHEIVDQNEQSTWQDYGLSVRGMQTGLYIGLGAIKPNQLGDYLRGSLGPSGYGSYGFTPFMIFLFPLQGNRKGT